jgi:hypothetical protein
MRCLPNVFFIGVSHFAAAKESILILEQASKSGTTSLFHALLKHPDVVAVRRRISGDKHSEIHLFDRPLYRYASAEVALFLIF